MLQSVRAPPLIFTSKSNGNLAIFFLEFFGLSNLLTARMLSIVVVSPSLTDGTNPTLASMGDDYMLVS